LLAFPDVFAKPETQARSPEQQELLKKELHLVVDQVLEDLVQMKRSEGVRLKEALSGIIRGFRDAHSRLVHLRGVIRERATDKIRKRIDLCFEAYPVQDDRMRALMENRISQEISHSLEKLDVEEELTRLIGHMDSVEQVLHEGGAVGKKLDFIFQELNREVNTLANKSQDLEISRETIALKMGIEQLREQSLNLE
jgi:uncharacterized protein (TIGR00255 family)